MRSLQVLGLRMKPYVPDFNTAFQHFCIHPGGKAVIEEVRLFAQLFLGYLHASSSCVFYYRVSTRLANKASCRLCNVAICIIPMLGSACCYDTLHITCAAWQSVCNM